MASKGNTAQVSAKAPLRKLYHESPDVPPTPLHPASRRPPPATSSANAPAPAAAKAEMKHRESTGTTEKPSSISLPSSTQDRSSPLLESATKPGVGQASTAATSNKASRGSLSEQLARISAQSDNLISGIKQSLLPDPEAAAKTAKLMVFGKKFVVGHLESLSSSPVQFYDDKCTYHFNHPSEKRVDMEMFYRDMSAVETNDHKLSFSFRILKPLKYFKSYNPTKERDRLAMTFTAHKDYIAFKARIFPGILASVKR